MPPIYVRGLYPIKPRNEIAKKRIVEPLFYVLTGTSILCVFLIIARGYQLDEVHHKYLIWNLFLAWLPLMVSMIALLLMRIGKGFLRASALLLCGVVWLLLFPNAPYLTTDFIHLIFDSSYGPKDPNRLLLWYDLVMFFLFSWCGLLLGFLSMRQFHAIFKHYLNPVFGWLTVIVVSFLGGFGVYLGRVIRLNSWDVLFRPFHLIESVLAGINAHAVIFTLLFGLLIFIVYLTLYILASNVSLKKRSESSFH